MSAGKFLAGFVVGGVVGSVIGLLLAPQSGEETRQLIAKNSKDVYDKAEKTVKEIQSKAKGDEIMEKIQGIINQQKQV